MAEQDKTEEAKRIIERATRESGGVLRSHLARTAQHLTARDADPNDPADVWGKRVGRALALLFLVALVLFVLMQIMQEPARN